MITCRECGNAVSSTAKSCPHCGAKIPHAKVWPWIVGVPVALLVAFLGYGFSLSSTPEGQARSADRDAISACWRQQKDPALDPSSQRFVAKTCQKMEADFRTKYDVDP